MTKAVIFDFDGVISDTYNIAFNILKNFDHTLTEGQFKDFYNGNLYKKITSLLKPQEIEIFFKQLREKTTKDHIFPLQEVFKKLSEKYSLFIVSSNTDENIEHLLSLGNLGQYFRGIFGATKNASKLEKFKSIFREFQLTANDCFFVTDTIGDIIETRELNVATIAITWGYHSEELLKTERPFAIAHDGDELLKFIETEAPTAGLVEIFDEQGNSTGQILSQQECLEKGLFKRCSWIFLLHKEKGILFQMRSKHKKLLPSHWHTSVSGHLDVGETPLEAGIREAKEELGINIAEDDLKFQGIFTEKVPLTDNRSTNDILYIYFVNWSDKGDNFSLSSEEVESTQWFSLEELERKFSGEWPENFVPYRKIFQSIVSLARDFIR